MGEAFHTKGSHILVAKAWVDERLGEGAFSGQARAVGASWSGTVVLPGGWYDVRPLNEVLTWVSARMGKGVRDCATEISTRNAKEDLSSIYRVFLRLATPVRLMGQTPRLWRNYVSFADSTAVRNDPGHYIGECSGMPDDLFEWAVGCWCGFLPAAIEMAGGKVPRARLLDRSTLPSGLVKFRVEIKYGT